MLFAEFEKLRCYNLLSVLMLLLARYWRSTSNYFWKQKKNE